MRKLRLEDKETDRVTNGEKDKYRDGKGTTLDRDREREIKI
jgi:hypothetical protein